MSLTEKQKKTAKLRRQSIKIFLVTLLVITTSLYLTASIGEVVFLSLLICIVGSAFGFSYFYLSTQVELENNLAFETFFGSRLTVEEASSWKNMSQNDKNDIIHQCLTIAAYQLEGQDLANYVDLLAMALKNPKGGTRIPAIEDVFKDE